MRIEHRLEIEAPIESVWALTLDIESWPTITRTMTSVTQLDEGPLRIGSPVRIKQPGQRARVWTVTALDAQRRLAWSTTAMGVDMTGIHQLTSSTNGTTNELTIELDGTIAPIVGALLRRPIAHALATENRGFKAAGEG
jgi:uncharacterized membrane protein